MILPAAVFYLLIRVLADVFENMISNLPGAQGLPGRRHPRGVPKDLVPPHGTGSQGPWRQLAFLPSKW